MGKIVKFKRGLQRWLRSTVFPLALIVILSGAVGVVGYFKGSPSISTGLSFQTPQAVVDNSIGSIQNIVGRATVIDGDTIEIHGVRIRLFGIDAPESEQNCLVGGNPTRCGQRAATVLADKIAGYTVVCEQKDRDAYGRIVAVCRAVGEDLNAWMVAKGWALAYRQYSIDYVPQEERAAASKLGMWEGEFIKPWDWRQDHPRSLPPGLFKSPPSGEANNRGIAQTGACNIKGNISANGERIYHVPGGKFYDKTIISVTKGERWFCSEDDARDAGWRRSRR